MNPDQIKFSPMAGVWLYGMIAALAVIVVLMALGVWKLLELL